MFLFQMLILMLSRYMLLLLICFLFSRVIHEAISKQNRDLLLDFLYISKRDKIQSNKLQQNSRGERHCFLKCRNCLCLSLAVNQATGIHHEDERS